MIKIAHLYYDLMNLYGDNGNIKALKKIIKEQDIEVKIEKLSIGDNIDFEKYDLYYMGPGTLNNELLVLNDILKYKNDINKAIKNNKHFIIIGNALELFGKYIECDKEKYNALDILNIHTKKTLDRLVSEVKATSDIVDNVILGFKNQDGIITNKEKTIFNIESGYGFNINDKTDGITTNNFFGTYMIGPILVRNPQLLIYFAKKITGKDIIYDSSLEEKAHKEYINNYFK